MSHPEQKLWQLIKSHMPGHAMRVENVLEPGVLDVNFKVEDTMETWLELKVSNNKRPINEDQAYNLLRPEQKVWSRKRIEARGRCLLLVRQGDTLLLYSLRTDRAYSFSLFKKPFDWLHFTGLLAQNPYHTEKR